MAVVLTLMVANANAVQFLACIGGHCWGGSCTSSDNGLSYDCTIEYDGGSCDGPYIYLWRTAPPSKPGDVLTREQLQIIEALNNGRVLTPPITATSGLFPVGLEEMMNHNAGVLPVINIPINLIKSSAVGFANSSK